MIETLADLCDAAGVEVLDHLDLQVTIPVLTGLQAQGDVAVIPRRKGKGVTITVPPEGIPVVRGEAGGNTHLLVADGPCVWRATTSTDLRNLTLGMVTVPEGSTAFLLHPEHGGMGMAPGTYEIRRQREQADEIRVVAD